MRSAGLVDSAHIVPAISAAGYIKRPLLTHKHRSNIANLPGFRVHMHECTALGSSLCLAYRNYGPNSESVPRI